MICNIQIILKCLTISLFIVQLHSYKVITTILKQNNNNIMNRPFYHTNVIDTSIKAATGLEDTSLMSFGSKINLQLNLPTDDINAACSYISNPKEILFATWDKDKTKQLSDNKFLLSFPLILLPGLGNIQPEIEVSMIYNNQRITLESGDWTIRATSGAIMKDSRFLSTFDIKLKGQLSLVPPTNQLPKNKSKYLQAVGWVEYKVQGSKPKFFRNAPNFVLDNTINIIQTMANDYATSVFVSRFTKSFREFMFKKFSKV
mmetsp:Transcript_21383/g.19454  ORF Transcript_21383/g.19454 Transcript_21383/m.19454 type:complete len:259 (+) Transcript_21383:113-889(+)